VIFSRDEAAAIRQGKLTAALISTTSKLKPDRTTMLRRRFKRHDSDGKELKGWATEVVADVSPEGDRKSVVLTVLSVNELHLDDLTQQDAEACGFRTLPGMKDNWRQHHRGAEMVKIVRFAVGDLRDRDRYLSRPSRSGGDYTSDRHRAIDDVAVLTDEQLKPFVAQARERDKQRRKRAANDTAKQPLEARLGRLDDLKQRQRVDISREIRVIEERVRRAERDLRDDAA
jgi:hypothetical protein